MKCSLVLWAFLAFANPAHARPLALVFSVEPIALSAQLRHAGWDVRLVEMPCGADLDCWSRGAHKPGMLRDLPARVAKLARGRERVALIGVSRGGYLALRLAGTPGVTEVVALSPVTDLMRLTEFRGVKLSPEYRLAPAHGRVFIAIGNEDERVGTDAAMAYAVHLVGGDFTLHVLPTKGHVVVGQVEALAWLR